MVARATATSSRAVEEQMTGRNGFGSSMSDNAGFANWFRMTVPRDASAYEKAARNRLPQALRRRRADPLAGDISQRLRSVPVPCRALDSPAPIGRPRQGVNPGLTSGLPGLVAGRSDARPPTHLISSLTRAAVRVPIAPARSGLSAAVGSKQNCRYGEKRDEPIHRFADHVPLSYFLTRDNPHRRAGRVGWWHGAAL